MITPKAVSVVRFGTIGSDPVGSAIDFLVCCCDSPVNLRLHRTAALGLSGWLRYGLCCFSFLAKLPQPLNMIGMCLMTIYNIIL